MATTGVPTQHATLGLKLGTGAWDTELTLDGKRVNFYSLTVEVTHDHYATLTVVLPLPDDPDRPLLDGDGQAVGFTGALLLQDSLPRLERAREALALALEQGR